MDQIVLVGTGSLATEITQFIEEYKLFEVIAYTQNKSYIKAESFMDKPIYPIEELDRIVSTDNVQLFSTVSWYNYLNRVRKEKYEEMKKMNFRFANLISPHAIVHTDELGEGNWIHDMCLMGYGAKLGNNNIFRSYVSVGHYTQIGNHNTFTPKVNIGGHCMFGDASFIGMSAVINNRVVVGNRCVVGSGTVVKKDLPDFSLVVANDPFIKQCTEEKIEQYISPKHVKRSVEEFEKLKQQKDGQ